MKKTKMLVMLMVLMPSLCMGWAGLVPFFFPQELWDDIRTPWASVDIDGARHPDRIIIANDGSTPTGYSYDFNDGDTVGDVPFYAALDVTEMSFSVWFEHSSMGSQEYFDRQGQWEFYVSGGDIQLGAFGNGVTADTDLTIGQKYNVVVTMALEATKTRVKIYVNDTLVKEELENDTLGASAYGLNFGSWYSGGWNFDGKMDDVNFYNVVLTPAQVSEIYNGGAGISGQPTGITQNSDVIARFLFEENVGTTVDNACLIGSTFDMALTNGDWATGLIGVTSGSVGVAAGSFPPGRTTEVWYTGQFSHEYKEGRTVYPHVHWSIKEGSGNVVIGIEYTWTSVGMPRGNTTIVERVLPVGAGDVGIHRAADLVVGGIDGTGQKLSSVMSTRFYRKGDDPLDTFTGAFIVGDFDTHYPKNSDGSRGIWFK